MLATPTSFGSHGSRSLETGEGTRGFLEIKKRDKISVFFFSFFFFFFFQFERGITLVRANVIISLLHGGLIMVVDGN